MKRNKNVVDMLFIIQFVVLILSIVVPIVLTVLVLFNLPEIWQVIWQFILSLIGDIAEVVR